MFYESGENEGHMMLIALNINNPTTHFDLFYTCHSNSCSFFSFSVLNSELQYRHLMYEISLMGIVLLLLFPSSSFLLFALLLLVRVLFFRKDMLRISCLYCSTRRLRVYSHPCLKLRNSQFCYYCNIIFFRICSCKKNLAIITRC